MGVPVRLGAAENTLIAQLHNAGAAAEAERLAVAGLPTRRVESYHYTDLKMLLRTVPPLAESAHDVEPTLDITGAFRLSLINGQLQPHSAAPAGVAIGETAGSALTERDDVLVRLNTALARKTVTIDVRGEPGQVIHLDRRTVGAAGHSATSARVFVADGAQVTLLETFGTSEAAHLANHSTFVQLGAGATLTHVTVDVSRRAATHFASVEYEVGANAHLRTLTVHAGAGLERTQMFVHLGGEGTHADFTGLNLVKEGQHSDITLNLNHAVPHCSSKPLFKQIARGRSRAAFQGKILVSRGAQKTDAKLMMQGLMLSDEAEILSKPELEIYADDVVCGHGSTCGKLDEDSMFYLMSRGVPKHEAETILVRGFIAELLDAIDNEPLNAALQGIVDGWLAGP